MNDLSIIFRGNSPSARVSYTADIKMGDPASGAQAQVASVGAEDMYLVGDGGDARMRVRPNFSSPSVEEAYGYRTAPKYVPRAAERPQQRPVPALPRAPAARRFPATSDPQYPKPLIGMSCMLGVAAVAVIVGIIVVSSRKRRA